MVNVKRALLFVVVGGILFWLGTALKSQRRAPGNPIPLHACSPSPAQLAEIARQGRELVDAKCDDRGGVYMLTKPRGGGPVR